MFVLGRNQLKPDFNFYTRTLKPDFLALIEKAIDVLHFTFVISTTVNINPHQSEQSYSTQD